MGTVMSTPGGDLFGAPLPESDLARGADRFEGDAHERLRQSLRAVERAFGELDACDAVLDRATARGRELAGELGRLVAAESEQDVPPLLDALKELADEVQRSEESRRVVGRILGQDEPAARPGAPVPHLPEEQLPPVPSVYDEQPARSDGPKGVSGLLAEFEPRLRVAHAERIRQAADHLVGTVRRLVGPEFIDTGFVHDSLVEADLTFELWRRCLADRRLDLD
ncbi:hypothetical protein GCM10010430_25300 [Kitasatospora cystarginea]|uniref:Uncharacterized protein n=2 Tax=Kitasatospora cystarginea TaxID=58350 RepID=A0ABN3DVX5_9ACTN